MSIFTDIAFKFVGGLFGSKGGGSSVGGEADPKEDVANFLNLGLKTLRGSTFGEPINPKKPKFSRQMGKGFGGVPSLSARQTSVPAQAADSIDRLTARHLARKNALLNPGEGSVKTVSTQRGISF